MTTDTSGAKITPVALSATSASLDAFYHDACTHHSDKGEQHMDNHVVPHIMPLWPCAFLSH